MKVLSEVNQELEETIVAIVESGNSFHDDSSFKQALNEYFKAWELLPEMKQDWEIASWISACIFSAYFDMKDFSQAKGWAEIAFKTRGSDIDTGPILDLGMVSYELKQFDDAFKYFSDAYDFGKARAFKERPKKYLDFYLNTKKEKNN